MYAVWAARYSPHLKPQQKEKDSGLFYFYRKKRNLNLMYLEFEPSPLPPSSLGFLILKSCSFLLSLLILCVTLSSQCIYQFLFSPGFIPQELFLHLFYKLLQGNVIRIINRCLWCTNPLFWTPKWTTELQTERVTSQVDIWSVHQASWTTTWSRHPTNLSPSITSGSEK